MAWITANPTAKQPWDQPFYTIPGGDLSNPMTGQIMAIGNAMMMDKSHGNYIGVKLIMQSVYEGSQITFDNAMKVEEKCFIKTL